MAPAAKVRDVLAAGRVQRPHDNASPVIDNGKCVAALMGDSTTLNKPADDYLSFIKVAYQAFLLNMGIRLMFEMQ